MKIDHNYSIIFLTEYLPAFLYARWSLKAHDEFHDNMFTITVLLVLQVKEAFAGRFAGFKSVLLKSGIGFVNCLDQVANNNSQCFLCPPIYSDSHFLSLLRCGSITVDLTLIFNSKIKEHDVITVLRNASEDGRLGDFSLNAINRERSHVDLEIGKTNGGTITPPGGKLSDFSLPIKCTPLKKKSL